MKILIISTYFLPDTTIAAVRPYQFAKRLSGRGHNVTVIRYGLVDQTADYETEIISGFRLLTATDTLEFINNNDPTVLRKQKLAWLPPVLRRPLVDLFWHHKFKKRSVLMKKVVDSISDESFDVVFSTYGDLETIFTGEYAARVFHAKWILDFRDPITHYSIPGSYLWNLYATGVYKRFLKKTDAVTTVSRHLSDITQNYCPNIRIYTLTNGYDPDTINQDTEIYPEPGIFSICYTGRLYSQSVDALDSLLGVMKKLFDQRKMEQDKVRFVYAGGSPREVRKTFEKYCLTSVLKDRGYLDHLETDRLQKESDVFLVLSWNTEKNQGIISGKFYEGIRAKRPILAVLSGDKPDSELYQMQQKYDYGFCYESCRSEMEKPLMEWLLKEYDSKLTKGSSDHKLSEELIGDFSYENITSRLDEIIKSVCEI